VRKADDETRALLIKMAGQGAVQRGWVYFTGGGLDQQKRRGGGTGRTEEGGWGEGGGATQAACVLQGECNRVLCSSLGVSPVSPECL